MTATKASNRLRLEDFELKEMISKGSFGTVCRIVHKQTRQVYALKQVQLRSMSRLERQEAIDEARMLSRLNHPYIIKHYESFVGEGEVLNIIMDYAAGGTVFHLVRQKKQKLPEEQIWKYAIQTILGLNYIHKQRIIHRDIKSLNLFLDAADCIKIGDFGIARVLGENTDMLRTIVGTPFYLSPELCEDKPYNEKSDVWALGVCLYEMCMGKHPFTAQNEGALIRKILKGVYPPPSGYSAALHALVNACLVFDQWRRPDSNALLKRADVVQQANKLGLPTSSDIPMPAALPGLLAPAAAQAPVDQKLASASHPGAAIGVAPSAAPHAPHLMGGNGPMANGPQLAHAPAANDRPPPANHPFVLAPSQLPAAQQQQQQQPAMPAGVPIAPPPQYAAPMYGQQLHAQAAMPTAGKRPEERHGHPFALHPPDSVDHLALHLQQMAINKHSAAQAHAQAYGAGQDNVHAGLVDNVKGMLAAYPETRPERAPQRARPEDMPAAGARHSEPNRNAPYGHDAVIAPVKNQYRAEERERAEAVWSHTYQRPQYARKRCPDLMITGPSMRAQGPLATKKAPQAQGVYVYEGSVATTTTYMPASTMH